VPDARTDAQLADRLAARTLELVDIASPSRYEAALAAHIAGVLSAGGVAVRDAGDGCLVADLPAAAAGAPRLLLAGHLDTVPIQDNVPGRRDGDVIHGAGASDMKAGLAVMVELGLALAARGGEGQQPAVTLCFFAREELPFGDSALTPLLARDADLRAVDAAVVLEPTANELHAGCLGNINATWTFAGRSGHSARPWQADNAIVRAARAIARVTDAAPPTPHTIDGLEFREVVSITQIAGGIATNVIPDRVSAHVNYRYAPDRDSADAERRLHELCAGESETLSIEANAPSGAVALHHPLIRALIDAGDLTLAPKQAWTPVAELAVAGVPAVNFGPGDPTFAHRRDEQVTADALAQAYRVLGTVLWS
jgi:succinyl-diaminopimelate desuccinylase